jgi:hypothetical protein
MELRRFQFRRCLVLRAEMRDQVDGSQFHAGKKSSHNVFFFSRPIKSWCYGATWPRRVGTPDKRRTESRVITRTRTQYHP